MTARLEIDALQRFVDALPADGLSACRQAAVSRLSAQGLPAPRHEDWKYTDLSPVVDLSNAWLTAPGPVTPPGDLAADIEAVTASLDADWLVIANGEVLPDRLQQFGAEGVTATLLSQSARPPKHDTPLANLNIALLRDGVEIRVARNRQLARPIGLLFLDSEQSGVAQARAVLTLEEGAAANIIEYHLSRGIGSHYANSAIDLELGAGACADYVRIQERAREHTQTARLDVRLGRDTTFRHAGFDLGGKLVRNDLAIEIGEPGASAAFAGLYLAGEGQHVDNHTRVDHRVGPANSEQEYRGVLNGNARAIWNGKAIVHAGADGTDARQANHNLLLSASAEIDAKPELEIYADDVKCSHGTTIGQLDETALYYLRPRGIARLEARRLLTEAFAQGIVARVSMDALRETLAERVAARLAELAAGGDA